MIVVILFEHAARELKVANHICREIRLLGGTVEIFSQIFERKKAQRFIAKHGCEVLIVPYVYSDNTLRRYRSFIKAAKRLKVVNFKYEQVVAPFNASKLIPKGEIAKRLVTHRCENAEIHRYLVARGVPEENLFISGINFETKRKAMLKLASTKQKRHESRCRMAAKYDLDVNKKWIFYCEDRDWVLKDRVRLQAGYVAQGADPVEFEEFYRQRYESLMLSVNKLRALPQNYFETHEVIYRQHPGVSGVVKISERVRSISDGSVSDWYGLVDALVGSGTSTLLEGHALNIPTFVDASLITPERFRILGISDLPTINGLADIKLDEPNLCNHCPIDDTSLNLNFEALPEISYKEVDFSLNYHVSAWIFESYAFLSAYLLGSRAVGLPKLSRLKNDFSKALLNEHRDAD